MKSKATKLFKKAFEKPALEPIDGERQWDTTFSRSHNQLEKLADRALEEFRAGRTREMGFDEL